MTIFKIYKMLKRKTSFILMLPSIIAMITSIALSIVMFMIVNIATYYIFIANSKFGNGRFFLKINGLGLSICKKVIEKYAGILEYKNLDYGWKYFSIFLKSNFIA